MTNEGIVARAEMLIRSPVSKVFEAFVNPAITSRFWFSRGSARLEAGQSGARRAPESRARPLPRWPPEGVMLRGCPDAPSSSARLVDDSRPH